MPTPTFGGAAIFGVAPVLATTANPAQVQTSAYPQVNGVEMVNLGSRGRSTSVTGFLAAADLAGLAQQASAWRALVENATVAPLVAADGSVFPYAYVSRFQETGRVQAVAGGGLIRAYQAQIDHLV